MANWISSKLKVAETFLQQIDQTAAESLGKNENPKSESPSSENIKKSSGLVPLKDQLKKRNSNSEISEKIGLNSSNVGRNRESNSNFSNSSNSSKNGSFSGKDGENKSVSGINVKPKVDPLKSGISEGDWTELLGVSSQPSSPAVNRGNGFSRVKREGRKKGGSSSSISSLDAKRGEKNGSGEGRDFGKTGPLLGLKAKNEKDLTKVEPLLGSKEKNERDSTKTGAFLGSKAKNESFSGEVGKVNENVPRISSVERIEFEGKRASEVRMVENKHKDKGNEKSSVLESSYKQDFPSKDSQVLVQEPKSVLVESKTIDEASGFGSGEVGSNVKSSIGESKGFNIRKMSFPSLNTLKKKSPPASDNGSTSSETGSSSSSDSESEREREERKRKRAELLAERAAAKVVEAIKERENLVARLEGEKQSLEKILEERAKQQALEASELQNTTMEMMDAAELEKEKHNNTRMEALARLTKLEATNADLARSLAAAQKNLEVEINRIAEVRQLIESKEANQEELRRKISATYNTGNHAIASRGVEFEHEILESEYTFVTEKIERLQEKAKTLDMNIEVTRKEIEVPTEVEIELKRRLGQLTDHLIQKQAQVESLSSEKAMLAFRIEAVSRLLEENKSMLNGGDLASTSNRGDLESGVWEYPNSKLKPMFEQRMQSGRKHFGSLVRQLDSIFCAGAVFLRRNYSARIWSLVYLVCLHLWVMYILMSHSSPVSDESRSGAVFSLENINNTAGA